MMRWLGVWCVLVLFSSLAEADTTWVDGGSVAGRWEIAGSPYMITGDISVPSSEILDIGDGVIIYFVGSRRIYVSGGLNTHGTEGSKVIFTTDTLANPLGWAGIWFVEANLPSYLSHTLLQYGWALGVGENSYGGVMNLNNSDVTLDNCVLQYNRAGTGHAIFARHSCHLTLIDCALKDNGADYGSGGAICGRQQVTLTMTRCTVVRNYALYGGGIALDQSVGYFDDCTISKNYASISGGGMHVTNSTLNIANSSIRNNVSISGGGIDARQDVYMSMHRCLIVSNHAGMTGAEGPGGGLALQGGDQTIVNCTFVGNVGATGSACYGGRGLEMRNSILAFNHRSEALEFTQPGASVRYSCFAENDSGNTGGNFLPAMMTQLTQVNANGDSCDPYLNLFENPVFDDSSDTGLYLSGGSPCVDAGDPASPRDPDGTLADMGALWSPSLPVGPIGAPHPEELALSAIYPNPFNATAALVFDIAQTGDVSLRIVDLLGREVATLVDAPLSSGSYTMFWNAHERPSGTYFALLQSGGAQVAQKLMLVK